MKRRSKRQLTPASRRPLASIDVNDRSGPPPEKIRRGIECSRCKAKRTVIQVNKYSSWSGSVCALCLAELLRALLARSLGQRPIKGMV